MAESCTITEQTFGTIKKVKWAWVSAADGTVGAALVPTVTTNAYSGEIVRLVTVPGAAGLAPDDNYGVVVNDADGTDVLMSAGLLRDTANTEQVLASSLGVVANSTLTLLVTAAGAANGGTVYVYIR